MSKTDEKAEGIGKTLAGAIGTAGKWAAGLGAASAAVGAGIFKVSTDSAAAADNIDKMSQKIGISRQSYQELSFITSQCGMDVDKLQVGMKTLTSVMDATRDGTSKSATALEQLGIAATNSDGSLRSSEDVMYDAIAALQSMGNETERARLATELFGRAGTEMAPLLNAGAGSVEEMRQQAHDLGLVLSDDVINTGVSLTDTLDQMKRAFSAIGTNLGGTLMPLVEDAAQFLISNLPFIQNIFATLAPVISEVAAQLLPPLMDLVTSLLPSLSGIITAILPTVTQIMTAVLPIIVQLLDTLLPPMIQIVDTLLPPLLQLLQPILSLLTPLIALLQPILDLVISILTPLAELISKRLTPFIGVVVKVINSALVPLQKAFVSVSGVLSGVFSAAFSIVGNLVGNIKGVFTGLISFITGVFTGNWRKAWSGVTQIFSSVFNGIKEIFRAPINWIINGLNTFIRGINRIKIPDWVPGVGGKGINIGTIPNLAQGGVLEKGQTGFLEGNGAEAVVPLHNNRKWISAVAEDMDSAVGGSSGKALEAKLDDILAAVEQILKAGIYLDTGAMVGALARPMDKKLGQFAAQKARA